MARPSIPAEYTKPDFLSPSILKVTVLPLADFFVQLSIISSPPNWSQVSSRVCHRSGSVFPEFQELDDVEESTTHDTARLCPVIGRASLVPRLVRNRGTGRASHLLGTWFQPSLFSLSDCTLFRHLETASIKNDRPEKTCQHSCK